MPLPTACDTAGLIGLPFLSGIFDALSLPADFQHVFDDAFFYCSVREYIMNDIILGGYKEIVAAKLARALLFLSTTVITIWVIYHGVQIASGANRNPIVPLFLKTGKMALILAVVSLLARESPYIVDTVSNFKDLIAASVADGADITMLIDLNLGISALLSAITESLRAVDAGKDPNLITTTVGLLGQSGPAMLTGVLLMLAELALTFAIMLSPLFVFFLLFQQTAQLFWAWAKFMLATMVSMSTLTLIASFALKATAVYGGTVVAAYYARDSAVITALGGPYDISGSSLRLAALGTLMSAIIVSIPATIMQFFNAGVGFAAGAMGFAGGGALAASLGHSKGLGGGTGIPGLTYGASGSQPTRALGSQSQDASASSSTVDTAYANQQMIFKQSQMSTGSESQSIARNIGEGRVGLASENGGGYSNARMSSIRDRQSGAEFSHATGDRAAVGEPSMSRVYTNGTNVEDAVIKQYPQLGTGGSIAVSGTTAAVGSRTVDVIAQAKGPSNGIAYGGSTSIPQSVETPMHAAPRGQYGAANAAADIRSKPVSYASSSSVAASRDGKSKTG